MQKNQDAQQALFEKLSGKARKEGFAVELSEAGVSLVPLLNDEPIATDQYEKLGEEEKKRIEKKRGELNSEVQSFLRQVLAPCLTINCPALQSPVGLSFTFSDEPLTSAQTLIALSLQLLVVLPRPRPHLLRP